MSKLVILLDSSEQDVKLIEVPLLIDSQEFLEEMEELNLSNSNWMELPSGKDVLIKRIGLNWTFHEPIEEMY